MCPFVMRERMDKGETKRPVYRYVFSCQGHADILVSARVCNGLMRYDLHLR